MSLSHHLTNFKLVEKKFSIYDIDFQIEGNTPIHLFVFDYESLKLVLEYYLQNKPDYLWSIVIKNNQGKTPFDITIEYDMPKCTDLLLTYICYLRDGNYSRQIYKIFPILLAKGYKAFNKYLDSWMYQTMQMKNTKYLTLDSNEDIFMIAHSNCLLDRNFFEKYTYHGGKQKKLREKRIKLLNQQK